jgi:hypothetical protein
MMQQTRKCRSKFDADQKADPTQQNEHDKMLLDLQKGSLAAAALNTAAVTLMSAMLRSKAAKKLAKADAHAA